jgi:hypothetical protein
MGWDPLLSRDGFFFSAIDTWKQLNNEGSQAAGKILFCYKWIVPGWEIFISHIPKEGKLRVFTFCFGSQEIGSFPLLLHNNYLVLQIVPRDFLYIILNDEFLKDESLYLSTVLSQTIMNIILAMYKLI